MFSDDSYKQLQTLEIKILKKLLVSIQYLSTKWTDKQPKVLDITQLLEIENVANSHIIDINP